MFFIERVSKEVINMRQMPVAGCDQPCSATPKIVETFQEGSLWIIWGMELKINYVKKWKFHLFYNQNPKLHQNDFDQWDCRIFYYWYLWKESVDVFNILQVVINQRKDKHTSNFF